MVGRHLAHSDPTRVDLSMRHLQIQLRSTVRRRRKATFRNRHSELLVHGNQYSRSSSKKASANSIILIVASNSRMFCNVTSNRVRFHQVLVLTTANSQRSAELFPWYAYLSNPVLTHTQAKGISSSFYTLYCLLTYHSNDC